MRNHHVSFVYFEIHDRRIRTRTGPSTCNRNYYFSRSDRRARVFVYIFVGRNGARFFRRLPAVVYYFFIFRVGGPKWSDVMSESRAISLKKKRNKRSVRNAVTIGGTLNGNVRFRAIIVNPNRTAPPKRRRPDRNIRPSRRQWKLRKVDAS